MGHPQCSRHIRSSSDLLLGTGASELLSNRLSQVVIMRSRLSSLLMTIPAALLLTPSLWRGRGHTQHTLQLSLSNSFRLITTSIVLPLLLLYPSPSRSGYPAVLIPTLTLLLRALLTCGTSRSISRVNDLFTDPLRDHLIQLCLGRLLALALTQFHQLLDSTAELLNLLSKISQLLRIRLHHAIKVRQLVLERLILGSRVNHVSSSTTGTSRGA
mmetsp:Transcript_5543/g.5444  ORF Transcript_5543/g.5444 Transcript_5543/m.5444 type:complete len:214 (+) Transcript_5543:46-687(+)